MTKETERILSGMYKNEVLDAYMGDLLFCFIATGDLSYWRQYRDAKNLRDSAIVEENINDYKNKKDYRKEQEEENILGL